MKSRGVFVAVILAGAAMAQDDKTRQQFEEKRLQALQTAKGQCDLGKWCEGKKLKDEACPGVLMESCFSLLFLRRSTPRLDETIKTGTAAGPAPKPEDGNGRAAKTADPKKESR